MGFRWINTKHPRFWTCTLPSRYTLEEFSDEFTFAGEVLRGMPPGHRLIVLTDLSAVERSQSRNRARAGEFFRQEGPALRQHVVAWGFVSTDPIIRGAVTAIGWVGDFPVKVNVFGEYHECVQWLEQQLALDDLAREDLLRPR